MSIPSGPRDYDRFDALAEEFAERYRGGERPSLQEYVDRLPEMADEIREMFPALVEVEKAEGEARDDARRLPSTASVQRREIGDYRVVREVGRGGMGVVYEAEQISLGRRVALKVLPGHVVGDRRALERFRLEARAAARLHHTNIVPVFEVGRDGDLAFYAMQFIQGQGLDQVIDELARLRSRDGAPAGEGLAASGRRGKSVVGIDTASGAAAGPRNRSPSQVAESLLVGRLGNEGWASSNVNGCAATEPAGNEPFGLDAIPATGAAELTGQALAEPPPSVDASSSAVLPGGTALSSVDSSIRRQPFYRSVAQIGRQTAQGLAYAHSRGIVHRDIKPSNLLLDTAGVVWITDFGLAKAEESGLTRSGDILGTLRYMAPERFRGEGDARADIYALGATLYELLTLRPAFDTSDRLKLMERVKNEEPVRPRALDPRIPRDLETIVLKAMDKDPARRYATAEALSEDLRRFLADEPIKARQVSAAERYWRWARRNPTIAALGGVLTAMLLLATVGSLLAAISFRQQKQTQEGLAAKNRTLADASKAATRLAENRADEIQQTLYRAEMNLAGQAAESVAGNGRVSELLGHWYPATAERDWRGWEWYYLSGVGRKAPLSWLHRHHSGVWAVRWSPDGRRLATCGLEGKIRLWDGSTGRIIATLQGHTAIVDALRWDPHGRRLASASQDETVRLWDTDAGREIVTLRGHKGQVRSLSWSPDGRRLASAGHDGAIKIWDPDGRREIASLRGHGGEVHPLSWNPDGTRLVSGSHDGTIKIWDANAGRETATLHGKGEVEHALSWSPDGTRLASAGERGTVTLWDPETGRRTVTLRGHTGPVRALDWAPDNRNLASAGSDGTIKIWEPASARVVANLQGHPGAVETIHWNPDSRRLASGGLDPWLMVWEPIPERDASCFRGHTDAVWCVRWSPDGTRLASGSFDQSVTIWDAANGQETATLRGHTSVVAAVCWSPDGTRLASGSHDGTVKLWDATSGRELATLRGHGGAVTAVSWSPDGTRLASTCLADKLFVGMLNLWNADTGRELATRPDVPALWAMSWSPDGRLLAGATATGAIKVWDGENLQEITALRGHAKEGRSICWSPDGQRLASGGGDRRVRVWDLATGRETATLSGHTDWVVGVSWSPDGRRLATASNDGTVKIWDPDTGQETATLRGHGDRVSAVSWSPDGQRLVSASWDRTLRIWDASPGYMGERSPELLPVLERRLAVQPQRAADVQLRAEIHARLGHWDQAAADWAQAAHLRGGQAPQPFQAGWWVLGPVADSTPSSTEPNLEPDPFQPVSLSQLGASNAAPLYWRGVGASTSGSLDFGALFPNARSGTARALLRIYALRNQQVSAQLGSSSSYRFWLNGHVVRESASVGFPEGDDEKVPLILRAGWNNLLFHVTIGNENEWLSLTLE